MPDLGVCMIFPIKFILFVKHFKLHWRVNDFVCLNKYTTVHDHKNFINYFEFNQGTNICSVCTLIYNHVYCKKKSLKGSDRLCKVVELSMQCCEKLLSDSFGLFNFLKICKSWVWAQIRRSTLLLWGIRF